MSHMIILTLSLILLLAVPVMAAALPGRITVYSVPTGALACVNSTTCDTTPANFVVEGNARHTVTVSEKGYHRWTEAVYVTSEQISLVTAYLDLNPSETGINVSVSPGGATVCLDNSDCRLLAAGSTSGTLYTGVSPGYHTVSIEGPADYLDTTRLVEVALGEITKADIRLQPFISPVTRGPRATGTVRVYVDRTCSTICIDNQDCYVNVGGSPGLGTATAIFSDVIADEMHIITVAADGYRPFSARVTVGKDLVATVDVTLQPVTGLTTVPRTTTQPATTTETAASPPAATTAASPATATQPVTAPPVAPIPTKSNPGPVLAPAALVLCAMLFLISRQQQ